MICEALILSDDNKGHTSFIKKKLCFDSVLFYSSTQCGSTATGTTPSVAASVGADGAPSLAEACSDGDVGTVRKLLTEGRSVHETTEEGESLLSLACSAGYYELAQVLLAMHASVEDRGIKVLFFI